MDVRRFSRLLMMAGLTLFFVSLIWWGVFYDDVFEFASRITESADAKPFMDVLPCLYSNAGTCGVISGFAQLGGATPYEPMVFWAALGLMVVGLLISFSAKSPKS